MPHKHVYNYIGILRKNMEVKLINITGGHLTVDIKLTDSPIQQIKNVIEQLVNISIVLHDVDDNYEFALNTSSGSLQLLNEKPIIKLVEKEIDEDQKIMFISEFLVLFNFMPHKKEFKWETF